MNRMTIQGTEILIKNYEGQRVVTFNDVDRVHQRVSGTASRNFNQHRDKFLDGIDFFIMQITDNEIRSQFGISPNAGRTVILLTETGYLMLVKSLTDDLAWKVQRELVNSYFRARAEPDKEVMQGVIDNEVPTVVVATDKLIQCAEIMAGCLDGNRPYVLNILQHIIPTISEEKVTEKVITSEKRKVHKSGLPQAVDIDVTKMLTEMAVQGMTLETLAERSQVTVNTIIGWIRGNHRPVEQNRKNVCAVLGKDEDFLTPRRTRNVRCK